MHHNPELESPMKRYIFSAPVRGLLLALLAFIGTGAAQAALGQAPSVAAPGSAPSGARMLAAVPAANGMYTVHEAVLANGSTVREYASAGGIVFAVTWKGPLLPDLGALLGNYFPTLQLQTEQNRQAGLRRAPVTMERDGLVLQSMGHMRNFFGSAYAPALVPNGVSINHVLQ